jgi:hypothetical protein
MHIPPARMYFFHYLIRISLALFCFILSGCIISEVEKRPASWPALEVRKEDFSLQASIPFKALSQMGALRQEGRAGQLPDSGYRPMFVISDRRNAGLYLTRQLPADTLMLWKTGQIGPFPWNPELRKVRVKVKKDALVILPKYVRVVHGGDPFLGFWRDHYRLYYDENGDLNIEAGSSGLGLVFMLFPTYMRSSKWFRYESDTK